MLPEYKPVGLQVPGWWLPPPIVTDACSNYDSRHGLQMRRAETAYVLLRADPTSLRVTDSFDLHVSSGARQGASSLVADARRAMTPRPAPPQRNAYLTPSAPRLVAPQLNELRRTRFFIPEKYNCHAEKRVPVKRVKKVAAAPPPPKPKPKVPWSLGKSIWAPRKKWSDAKDFYDSGQCLADAFYCDWGVARASGSLDKLIGKHSVAGGKPSPEQTAEAVKEVEEVLLQHLQLIYAMCAAPSRAVAPFASPLAQTTHTSSPDLRLSLSLPPTTPSLRLACAASI